MQGGGESEQRRESLKVMWLIEHQQPQIRLCPFVSFSQCVDGEVTRLKALRAGAGGAGSGGRSLVNADPELPQFQQGWKTVHWKGEKRQSELWFGICIKTGAQGCHP